MSIRLSICGTGRAGAVLALAALLSSGETRGTPRGDTLNVLYSFAGNPDAEYPYSDLVVDDAGNLYGMSVLGGTFGSGTVYRLAPSEGGWNETVLYSFTSGADGGQPYGGVTLDREGNLYGTAVVGGSGGACVEDGCGVVWKLTRSAGDTWTHSVIHDFTGEDGYGPGGPVVFDGRGNLYGMTPTGGRYGLGVIYQLTPRPNGWKMTVIHAFTGGLDGATGSAGRLLVDGKSIYGVATVGGAYGLGNVFRLDPTSLEAWTLTTLYSFKGDPDGLFPYGGLVRDDAGNMYGTTYYGGALGYGCVYMLSEDSGGWHEKVIYNFRNWTDGGYSIGHLVLDSSGNLYGTTSEGGYQGCGCGTIFKLSPPASPLGQQRWKFSLVHLFTGSPDGSYPYNGLVADSAGILYGTTVHGGDDDDGTIYRIVP